MKIRIGPFRNWYGPYQIMDWFKPIFGEKRIEKFTDGEFFDKWSDRTMPFFNWIESKKERDVRIRIDKYDTWNMDGTLSLIILPMLIQLQDQKHGSPFVDDEDVPIYLRSSNDPKWSKEDMNRDGTTDCHFHERWEYVINEMIWAFTEHSKDDWQHQYHTGESDIQWKEVPAEEVAKWREEDPDMFKDIDGSEMPVEPLHEMVNGPKDTSKWDKEGHMKHQARISNGLRLFGKYYEGLWS